MNTPATIPNKLALGVIILAAGFSTRMGRPKLLLPWGNTTVIGHLIQQWQMLSAEQIAVVCRAGDNVVNAELDRLNFPANNRIKNPQAERGMFSSILCAANWAGWHSEISNWAVVLGDQPHLHLNTLRQLLEFAAHHPGAICQPEFGGRGRHPVLLPRSALAELSKTGAGNLKDFLEKTKCPLDKCLIKDSGLSLDIDTPEDYNRFLSR